jgi:HEAT repeat protein
MRRFMTIASMRYAEARGISTPPRRIIVPCQTRQFIRTAFEERTAMNSRLPAWIGGSAIAIAFAVAGFAFVKYLVERPSTLIRQPSRDEAEADEPGVTPFTLAELEKQDAKTELSPAEIARLVACFQVADEDARLQAELILAKHPALALDKVRARLRHKDARVRFCAAETLGFMGAAAAAAADDLVKRLSDDNADVRYKAVFALGRLGVRNEPVLTGLINALSDKDESVRDTVLEVLDKIDTLPKETVPALARLLAKDASQDTRSKVLPILAKTGDPAVPIFRDMLKNIKPNSADPALYGDYLILIESADKLGPPQLKALLPELSALLAKAIQASQGLEPQLVSLFKKCGPDGARSMAETLKSVQKTHNNRLTLLHAIGEMGPDAKVAVPLLIDVLKANTPTCFPVEYRPQILEALGDIGVPARAAIPAIEALLKEPALADDARAALRRLGVIDKK